MKILVVTPILRHPSGKAQLFTRALASIYNVRWAYQLDHYQAVGGEGDYLRPSDIVTRKYQEAQKVFLAGNWDAMFCCEYDMVIPENALEKLVALNVDIAYGLYVLRHGQKVWNAITDLDTWSLTSLSDNPDAARKAWGGVVDVAGIGQGCTLIKRHVLEQFSLRNWKGVSCDWALAMDARAAGLRQVCDTSVVCGHMTITPSRQTLWPDINEPKLYRQEFPT
jgi:hypothetical protein